MKKRQKIQVQVPKSRQIRNVLREMLTKEQYSTINSNLKLFKSDIKTHFKQKDAWSLDFNLYLQTLHPKLQDNLYLLLAATVLENGYNLDYSTGKVLIKK